MKIRSTLHNTIHKKKDPSPFQHIHNHSHVDTWQTCQLCVTQMQIQRGFKLHLFFSAKCSQVSRLWVAKAPWGHSDFHPPKNTHTNPGLSPGPRKQAPRLSPRVPKRQILQRPPEFRPMKPFQKGDTSERGWFTLRLTEVVATSEPLVGSCSSLYYVILYYVAKVLKTMARAIEIE